MRKPTKGLTPFEKYLYHTLKREADKDGFVYASNSEIAELMGASRCNIATYVTRLVKKGMLTRKIAYSANGLIREIKLLNPEVI